MPADAHNPLAERRLTKADFVSMNHTTSSEEGGMLPVLPVQQLEEIYDRCGPLLTPVCCKRHFNQPCAYIILHLF